MVRWQTGRAGQHLAFSPALAILHDTALPVALIAAWVAVVAVLLWWLRPRPRPDPARSEWFAAMAGPIARNEPTLVPVRKPTGLPVQVVAPDTLPDFDDVHGLALEAAELNDIAGPVLTAGRRPVRRLWHGVLVHGDAGSGRTLLVRALAGEHHVPLLLVDARDLVSPYTDSPVAAIFAHAAALAPCVLLIVGVDQLADERAGVDATMQRRTVNDLAGQLRALSTDHRVVVVGTAQSADQVSPLLRCLGCFDRRIAVRGPNRAERERIIRRELVFAGATYRGALSDVVRMTRDMTARQVRHLVEEAVRSARLDLDASEGPVTLTLRDMRVGLYLADASTFDPLTIEEELSRRVRRFAHDLDHQLAPHGLALIGEDGGGKTTIARWLADSCGRDVTWLTGGDLGSLTTRDLEAIVDAACSRAPVLVVIDELDADPGLRSAPMIDAKHLAVALERLLGSEGVAVVITARERASIPRIDEGLIASRYVGRPEYHTRLRVIRHVLADADLIDTTPEQLAALLHGVTRAEVVDACRRALRAALIATAGTHGRARLRPPNLDAEDVRPAGYDGS